MPLIDRRDREILASIEARGEIFFKELEASGMMAKSTLSKHLRRLEDSRLIKRIISKRKTLRPHGLAYVVTARGKKVYYQAIGGPPSKLDDW